MSIRPKLFEYLDHFGETITVGELAHKQGSDDVVALRHDVDHDLDLALELAHHEHQRGIRATYFLLHTHAYWSDPDLLLKCQQLEAYGHEVGLHMNVLTQWCSGECDDITQRIRELLAPLREAGISIRGVSAHGDRACYEHGFCNYWLWRELRSDNPAASESGRSAEGIAVDDPQWQVPYPADHTLRRADGAMLGLWQSSLAEHDLAYDAVHVPFDHYWTDTGGRWARTGDPLQHDLSRGRHQVLIHPWWWRSEQKVYFFLSSARCGTVWLSNFIDRATSCRGVHEFTLNNRYVGDELIADKRTTDDFDTLRSDRARSVDLIRQSLRWMRSQPRDVAEANVYLEPFLPELRELAPGATLVHLFRDGRDVVRSLINRGWYATPTDHKHPALPVDRWNQLTQFERACWYWRYTNESIMPHASARLCFEQMVADKAYLQQRLEQLGIIVHPLLAEAVFDQPMNVSKQQTFAAWADWPDEYQRAFHRICGELQNVLGYEGVAGAARVDEHEAVSTAPELNSSGAVVFDLDSRSVTSRDVSGLNVTISNSADGIVLSPKATLTETRNRAVVLARGEWKKVRQAEGIDCEPNSYYTCVVDAEVRGGLRARLFVLFFDQSGSQVRKMQVGTLRSDDQSRVFSFSPALGASHLALALHLGGAQPDQSLVLRSVRVTAYAMDRQYAVHATGAAVQA